MWHSARVCQYNMTSSTTNSMIIEHRPNVKNKIIHETNRNQPVVEEISANANFPFLTLVHPDKILCFHIMLKFDGIYADITWK